ncbi:hypothetical protein EVAR_35990_1 [Eumeta japonica]|uniref:Uncharacterized protein n=1 Tax=Eumeta variegata TaxID=151549 RepID=A0A4C1WU69_EUMVA|nr:hypothetical protein EVAR_35990_1 [Eumeta japonica]
MTDYSEKFIQLEETVHKQGGSNVDFASPNTVDGGCAIEAKKLLSKTRQVAELVLEQIAVPLVARLLEFSAE